MLAVLKYSYTSLTLYLFVCLTLDIEDGLDFHISKTLLKRNICCSVLEVCYFVNYNDFFLSCASSILQYKIDKWEMTRVLWVRTASEVFWLKKVVQVPKQGH